MNSSTATKASSKAIDYLVSLSASRTPHVTEAQVREWAATVDRRDVSSKIDVLKALPQQAAAAKPALAAVPAGRYAVALEEDSLKFYKVDCPTEGRWAGYVFLKVQASDDLHPVRSHATKVAVLAAIAVNPQEASKRYGREIGACGVCGRTLTDENSIALGIGPICAAKAGW